MGRKIVVNYFHLPTRVVGAIQPNRHNGNADMVGIGKGLPRATRQAGKEE